MGKSIQKSRISIYICLLSLLIMVGCNFYLPEVAHAQLGSCSVSLSPQSMAPDSDNYFTFSLYDSDPNTIQWVQITAPTGGYLNVESAAGGGWTGNIASNVATLSGGSLSGGSSQVLFVDAYVNSTPTSSPIDWTVQASDDPGGANPITCSGDTSMSIVVQPSIINILTEDVTDVYPTKVTIEWTTDTASTSEVSYSTDTSYGSSTPTTDEGLVTNHSVTLTGLTPNTGYHFIVTSTVPSNGGTVTSGDDTFLTAAQEPGGGGDGQQQLSSTSNSIPILKTPVETTSPTIKFLGNVSRVQKTMPTISGIVTDNVAIASIEFSTDGGVNWLPVQYISSLGTKSASFSFSPINLDDGTYKIEARATNTSGITATTPISIVVVDRLPPQVGGDSIALGPQLLGVNRSGIISTMAGVDQTITLGTVGGPTSVSLTALSLRGGGKPQVFNLTKLSSDGLWSGIINFTNPGPYTLIAKTIDGAGVQNIRELNEFSVYPSASTVDSSNNKPISAKITVYYYVPETGSWAVWDGSSYGQSNPDNTGKSGKFGLFLPTGKYYLTAISPGFRKVTSNIFTNTQTEPISATLKLSPIHQLNLGFFHIGLDFPSLADQIISTAAEINNQSVKPQKNSLIGKIAPNFTLDSTNGSVVNTANLLGKPTVITIGTTWSPAMAEQIGTLSKLQTNNDLNVIPVALQQGVAITKAFTTISGLNLNWLVDPDSTITSSYNAQNLPTSYFVNREGVVKNVFVGVMSYQQMISELTGLN